MERMSLLERVRTFIQLRIQISSGQSATDSYIIQYSTLSFGRKCGPMNRSSTPAAVCLVPKTRASTSSCTVPDTTTTIEEYNLTTQRTRFCQWPGSGISVSRREVCRRSSRSWDSCILVLLVCHGSFSSAVSTLRTAVELQHNDCWAESVWAEIALRALWYLKLFQGEGTAWQEERVEVLAGLMYLEILASRHRGRGSTATIAVSCWHRYKAGARLASSQGVA